MRIKTKAQKEISAGPHLSNKRFKRLFSRKITVIGFVLVVFIIAVAIFAPIIAPNDPLKVNMSLRFEGPSSSYWLGTDNLGRCIASRIIWGARMSLLYSLCVLGLMLVISIRQG